MAMGPIMGIGGVDMLIPPSALTVLLGSLAGISISGLLIGGIVPGLILSAAVRRLHRRCAPRSIRRWRRTRRCERRRRRLGALAAVPRLRAAAGADLRHGGRRDDRRLGDADRGRGARRAGTIVAARALPQPDLAT